MLVYVSSTIKRKFLRHMTIIDVSGRKEEFEILDIDILAIVEAKAGGRGAA